MESFSLAAGHGTSRLEQELLRCVGSRHERDPDPENSPINKSVLTGQDSPSHSGILERVNETETGIHKDGEPLEAGEDKELRPHLEPQEGKQPCGPI